MLFFFSFIKLEKRRTEQVLLRALVSLGGGRKWAKGVGG
jgi:hypothetical protein